VEDCKNFLNKRPVEWLLENLPLNERFHLVHCTHMNLAETKGLALSKANVVLCPGTEGNLGDGIFSLTEYAKHGGSWSIGTDSHISLTPLEDLRWLDYAQRLTTHRRNTFDDGAHILLNKTQTGRSNAMGVNTKIEIFDIGEPFDGVVFNGESPMLERSLNNLLPSIIYAADSGSIFGTIVTVNGIVKNHYHINERSYQGKIHHRDDLIHSLGVCEGFRFSSNNLSILFVFIRPATRFQSVIFHWINSELPIVFPKFDQSLRQTYGILKMHICIDHSVTD
jgi:formimidoylglutamate deiminase